MKKKKVKKWKFWGISFLAFLLIGGGIAWIGLDRMTHRDVTEKDLGVEMGFFDFDSVLSEVSPMGSPLESSVSLNQSDSGTAPAQENEGSSMKDAKDNPSQETSATKSSLSENKNNEKNPSSSKETSSKGTGSSEGNPITEQQIYQRYYPAFSRLESLALSRIDELVAGAKLEYREKQGTPGFSKTEFASRYMSAVNKLQGEVDKVFYKLLDGMREELKANQLPLSLAEQAEKTYRDKIQAKKNEILGKAFSNDNQK
ncbi:hypothetical protein [Thermicanus aegyptius]|uniref:hypothetical protein n=1 Tax=Thermicanus aegyptius TaxID=94009 RepID=UPI00041A0EF0|nr:hypothetical protein [Thermicanus aegyptius]